MFADLADKIYEAAFVPDQWPAVLDDLAAMSGSASAAVLVFAGEDQPPRYKTTALTEAALHEFTTTDLWRRSERVPKLFSAPPPGAFSEFLYLNDFLEPEQIERDSVHLVLRSLGLGDQITTVLPMLTGEVVSFTFERSLGDGRHKPKAVAALQALRPHLARAGLMSARLGLERARASVSALEAIGLPAAMLSSSGQVLAANGLLEALSAVFRPAAFGGISILDPSANALFQQAIAALRSGTRTSVGSIPIRCIGDNSPFVVHLMPVLGAVNDIFSGAQILVTVTAVHLQGAMLPPSVLHGLFDLTPSEARIAAVLATGSSLAEAASAGDVTVKTARTYLERIFAKTGTHRQMELVALLKSAGPLPPKK